MKRIFAQLWYLSLFLFVFSFVMLFIYILVKTTTFMLSVCLISLAVASVLYAVCTKKMKFPQGFTLVQAVYFYNACKKAGISKPNMLTKKLFDMKAIADNFDFSKNLSDDDLKLMFTAGYQYTHNKPIKTN